MKSKLPKSWSEIKIGQYIQLRRILVDTYPTEIDRQAEILCLFTGKTKKDIDDMPIVELKRQVSALNFISDLTTLPKKIPAFFILNGKVYDVERNMNNITGYQFIDLSTFTKNRDEINENLHKILAVLCIPRKRFFKKGKYNGELVPELAELFYNELSMAVAYPLSVFFCNVMNQLPNSMMEYSDQELMKQKAELDNLMNKLKNDSMITMDGFSPSML